MRDLTTLDLRRVRTLQLADDGGVFTVPSPVDGQAMAVVASFGAGWDHISVSRKNRVPNWGELEWCKRLFFADDEWAMQLHVPPSLHINNHPYCLHLWAPNDGRAIPLPPPELVGIGAEPIRNPAEAEQRMRAAGLL